MANICVPYHFGDITLNAESGDTYITTDIQGLDEAPIRAEVDDKPQADGGLIFPMFNGPRHITFEGFIGIRSATFDGDKAAYIAAMDDLEEALIDELESMVPKTWPLPAATPLWWAGKVINVYHDSACVFRGDQFAKRFVFGLVAPDPVILGS